MKIDRSHRITLRLDFTTGLEPREHGLYIILDAECGIHLARWDGEYFVGDYKSIVAWCPFDRVGEISPSDKRKLRELLNIYGDFETTEANKDD